MIRYETIRAVRYGTVCAIQSDQVPAVLTTFRTMSVSCAILSSLLTIFRPKISKVVQAGGWGGRTTTAVVGAGYECEYLTRQKKQKREQKLKRAVRERESEIDVREHSRE